MKFFFFLWMKKHQKPKFKVKRNTVEYFPSKNSTFRLKKKAFTFKFVIVIFFVIVNVSREIDTAQRADDGGGGSRSAADDELVVDLFDTVDETGACL